jgi:hypothetical protein
MQPLIRNLTKLSLKKQRNVRVMEVLFCGLRLRGSASSGAPRVNNLAASPGKRSDFSVN